MAKISELKLVRVVCALCGSPHGRIAFKRGDGMHIEECVSCGLAFLNPRPREWDIPKLYDKNYFQDESNTNQGYRDYVSDTEVAGAPGHEDLREIIQWMETHGPLKGVRLLDVGCATGAFLAMARDAGAEVEGIEVSEFAAEEARKRHDVKVHLGTIEKLALPREAYDVVTMLETIEHVTSPRTQMANVAFVLRPGGRVLITTPNYGLGRRMGQSWRWFGTSYEHLYYFDCDHLVKLLEYEGLHAVDAMALWPESLGVISQHSKTAARLLSRARSTVTKVPLVRTLARGLYRGANRAVAEKAKRDLNGHKLVVLAVKGHARD